MKVQLFLRTFCFVIVAVLTTAAHAQDATGALEGRLTDKSEAVVAKANVELKNIETNVGRLFVGLGCYRAGTLQLLAVPALIPCLVMFLLPRYADLPHSTSSSLIELAEVAAAHFN